MVNYTPGKYYGWLIRLKVKDPIILGSILKGVEAADKKGKNVTEVMKKVEEKYGIDDEGKWE